MRSDSINGTDGQTSAQALSNATEWFKYSMTRVRGTVDVVVNNQVIARNRHGQVPAQRQTLVSPSSSLDHILETPRKPI